MGSPTFIWWSLLGAVSVVNVLAWVASVTALGRRSTPLPAPTWAAMRWQMLLSAGYVFGCAYRSAFPVFDVQRLCLVDSWLSSVIVGRSVATVAELCFAVQWALLVRGVAQATGSAAGVAVSRVIVPMIAVAELCSWYAVLTTSNFGHVFEETLWGLCAALLVVCLAFLWPRCRRELRPALAAICAAGVGYVIYMFGVDVPMYWSRWAADVDQGRPYLSIAQGLVDTSGRWVVSHRWVDWKSEVSWMSLYFSVAVWLSIGLIHLTGLIDMPNAQRSTTMKSTTAFSIVRVVRAMQYSEQGIRSAWRDEAAFRQELVLVTLLATLTLWLRLPRLDTMLLLALMGLVLVAELVNSGLEAVVDMTTPEFNLMARKAKDCGSAAVFVALLMLGGAWLTLAGPALWAQLLQ